MRITPKESLGPMHSAVPTLVASDASSIIWSIGPIILGLIVVVVVGWFVVVHVRVWMKASGESGEAFTLDDLRRMHRAGEISDAEFQRAREAMIGAVRSKGTKEPPPRNPDLDVLRQRHFAATQRASGSEKPPAPISPATPTIPPTVPSVPKSLMAPVTRPDAVRSIPPVQPKPSETLQSSYTPNHPVSLSDPSQHDPASRRDAVVRRPTILGDERFLREASGKDPEDPSESAAQ
jgi:hypothetical protein